MIGEVAVKAVEITAKTVEETAKETGKAIAEKSVDITKRIDVTKVSIELKPEAINISKRVNTEVAKTTEDIKSGDLTEAVKNYISDLKSKSDCADTIADNCLNVSKLEKITPDKVSEMREEFDDKKSKLRSEWEALNNREWPRYQEDVYNDNGVRIRKVGDCYDAHHIQPLSMGGVNEASNITPLDLHKHSKLHMTGGSCTNLLNKFEGVKLL